MPDPKSICPSRKHRVPEEYQQLARRSADRLIKAMCGIPWAGEPSSTMRYGLMWSPLCYTSASGRIVEKTQTMWLELHDNNGPIFVNMDTVMHFQRVEGQRSTTLVTCSIKNGSSVTLQVKESPDEIMEMLWEE